MIVFVTITVAVSCLVGYGVRGLMSEQHQKKRQLHLQEAFDRIVAQYKVLVFYHEIIGNRMIALDKKAKQLVVIDHSGKVKTENCIPLKSVSATSVVEEQNKDGQIERIVLELKEKKSGTAHRISFFDDAHDAITDLTLLAKKAQHWKNRVEVAKHTGSVGVEAEFVL